MRVCGRETPYVQPERLERLETAFESFFRSCGSYIYSRIKLMVGSKHLHVFKHLQSCALSSFWRAAVDNMLAALPGAGATSPAVTPAAAAAAALAFACLCQPARPRSLERLVARPRPMLGTLLPGGAAAEGGTMCGIVCTLRRVLISTESSTELCTGATARTHKDKDHHRGRCRIAVVQSTTREQSPGVAARPDSYLPEKATGQPRPYDDRLQTPTTIHT